MLGTASVLSCTYDTVLHSSHHFNFYCRSVEISTYICHLATYLLLQWQDLRTRFGSHRKIKFTHFSRPSIFYLSFLQITFSLALLPVIPHSSATPRLARRYSLAMDSAIGLANPNPSSAFHNYSFARDTFHTLDELFTLCRVPFVSDFLFASDPAADISILTSPVQNEHVAAARISASGFESIPTPNASLFNFITDFLFCSTPAFSVGSITVGFAINKPTHCDNTLTPSAVTSIPTCLATTKPSCARFVRDDSRGIFLLVSDFPTQSIFFDCTIHRTSQRRTRITASFHPTLFRQFLKSSNGVLDPATVSPSLQHLSISYDFRPCPICERMDGNECGCQLPFTRPTHPLDFRREVNNMILHTGQYQGETISQYFVGANTPPSTGINYPIVTSRLNSNVGIRGFKDRSVATSLCRLAVQIRLTAVAPSPLATSVSPNLLQMPHSTHLDPNSTRMVGTKEEFSSSTLPIPIPTLNSPALDDPLFSLQENEASLAMPGLSADLENVLTEGILDSLFDNFKDPSLVPDVTNDDSNLASKTNLNSEVVLGRGSSVGESVGKVTECTAVTDSECTGESPAKTFGSSHDNSNTVNWDHIPEIGTVSCGEDEPDLGTDRIEGETRSESDNVKIPGARSAIVKGQPIDNERIIRAEERRKRNRLAAAKSNVKRKIRNEALKRDLSEAKQRMVRLREKEKQLRAENVRLRVLAQNENLGVGIHLTHIQMTT